MHFEGYVLALTDENKSLTVRQVWNIRDFELSPIATRSFIAFEDRDGPHFSEASRIAVLSQSILEFQDLTTMMIPQRDRVGSVNYLFFESLSTLRESILAGTSGLIHSSLATMRSALEMLVFHEWWRSRLFLAETHEDFYEWLEGKRKSVPFRSALETIYGNFGEVPGLTDISDATEIYEFLCRYAHRPLLDQSTTPLRGGNVGAVPSSGLMSFWLKSVERVLELILHQLIAARPECLFEVDLYRKFGFNIPVGMFFDRYNQIALRKTLNPDCIDKLRRHYSSHDTVKSLLDWLDSHPDLADSEILASWSKEAPENDGHTIDEKVFLRVLHQKAECRALAWSFAYALGQTSIRPTI
ncbi:MAG TPA: hypothetical protein VIG34_08185 [Xanthobacteraceae bacterium]|jgi:hypothetical protein